MVFLAYPGDLCRLVDSVDVVTMRCEACLGDGRRLNPLVTVKVACDMVMIDNPQRLPIIIPCDECGGSGIAHCCDGLCVQQQDYLPPDR
jgi:hypothetical protein